MTHTDADWMNGLQHLSEKDFGPVLVTLNPPFEPRPETIRGRWAYDHPVLDSQVRTCSHRQYTLRRAELIIFSGGHSTERDGCNPEQAWHLVRRCVSQVRLP